MAMMIAQDMDDKDCIPNEISTEDEVTKPTQAETLAEVSARWQAELAELATSDRPTINIRPLKLSH